MNDEISFKYRGNPPEKFKKYLFEVVRVIMKDIKKEVLDNNGFVDINYINDENIELRAACNNPETLMKMTIKLGGISLNKVKWN